MAPLPPPEPSILLETKDSLTIKKIRFDINRIKLPMGIETNFGIIHHPGAAIAIPITNNGEVVLLRQYRFAISRRILEFPAGTLEDGEAPLFSMQRELGEEAGYAASQWDFLGQMTPCPGYSDEIIHMFLARDLSALEERPAGDDDEDIEVLHMSKDKLNEYIESGDELLDGKSITAWYRACQFLKI
ncbi:NUDIX hydrolase [Prochlorococcus sp. MIT 1307]|uniref:NUDIX hydrolase n=1 Tax=Prochlorococcus sp. MIT 1307 TaxID=3096219 RepID=UPI002A75E658|nr:NUDIX hydrolase [Prochlorococcus sp. MIT 1307]